MLFLHFRRKGLTVTKATPKERVQWAINEFDQNLRHQSNWIGWETNRRYHSAIAVAGKRYPAKKIVALASAKDEQSFSGAFETTRYLRKAGFQTEAILHPPASILDLHFERGAVYDRKTEIHGPFGGSHQSGIAPSSTHPAIFIFTGEAGEQHGYLDDWLDDNTFLYTGEGQKGPMTLTKGNLAIAEHVKTGKSLYLFQSLAKGKGHRFDGEFVCEGFFQSEQADKDGDLRSTIVFRLSRIEAITDDALNRLPSEHNEFPLESDLIAARNAALSVTQRAPRINPSVSKRNIYQRSRVVAHYVIMRSKGVCESCSTTAPFLKVDGQPYLEPHHINRVSDGGLDHPQFVAAICPNCHREIHSGANGERKNLELAAKIKKAELLYS